MTPELRRRLQTHPGFFAGMAVLTILALGAGLALGEEIVTWQKAGYDLAEKQREQAGLSAVPTGPTTAALEALRAEVEQAQAGLFIPGAEADEGGAPPAGRIEAYSDLNAFVERTRARAARAGVMLAADERFGFGEFARVGPALEQVPEVWRRRSQVERLLETLWSARPQSLAGVWCEPAEPDDAERESKLSGMVATERVRLAFVGNTACLRRHLAALAGLSQPAIVRDVQAERLPVDTRSPHRSPGTRFSLTLDLLRPIGAVPAARADLAGGAFVSPWRAPAVQSGGAGWCFEIFDPPPIEYAKDRRAWLLVGGDAGGAPAEDSGLELVAVRRLPYRWRLVGYGGGSEDRWVVLEDAANGRSLRLRQGEGNDFFVPRLVEWRLVPAPGGALVAEAKVRDETNEERWLRAGVAAPGEGMAAVVRVGATGKCIEGVVGATVRLGAGNFRIDAITETPAAVELTRLDEQGKPTEAHRLVAQR